MRVQFQLKENIKIDFNMFFTKEKKTDIVNQAIKGKSVWSINKCPREMEGVER